MHSIKPLLSIIRHELRITLRQAFSWITPLLFFLIVVCLFPLALSANPELLHQIAPGIIWIAVLLATLLSIGNLFRSDAEEGHLDLVIMSRIPLTLLVLCKVISHWLTHCFPLILLTPLLGLLLNLNSHEILTLVITLLLGTPVLSLLGAIGAALTIGIRQHGLLLPILIMPLYIPVLIFGTGAVIASSSNQAVLGYYAIMGAFVLLCLAFAPLLAGISLRIGVNQ